MLYPYEMETNETGTIWLKGLPESLLAPWQQNQGLSNHCGEFAVAAALGLLFNRVIAGMDLVEMADRGWLTKGLRCWPGGPTLPVQQARLAQEYATLNRLPVETACHRGTFDQLRRWLEQPDTACLVTIAWDNRRLPRITSGAGDAARIIKSRYFWSGHSMVLAAFQPAGLQGQIDGGRWGFINSWEVPSNGPSIFWMQQDEFKRVWEYPLFPIGSRNVVLVKKLN